MIPKRGPQTAEQLRASAARAGICVDGVDFDKVAAFQADDQRYVDGWEAPRALPPDWIEVSRFDDGGAKYVNANRSLATILSCVVENDGRAWLHLSVSHRTKRTPTHGEMRTCKELFLGDRYAYAVWPPRALYVNIMEVLHLFALLDEHATVTLPEFSGGTGSL